MSRKKQTTGLKLILSNQAKAVKIVGLKWENVDISGKLCTVIVIPPEGVKFDEVNFESEE